MRRRVVPLLNILLDDGGVITDKQRRAAEFERLVGVCFVTLLGRTEAAWTRAHRTVVDRLADPLSPEALAPHHFVCFYRADPLPWAGSPPRGQNGPGQRLASSRNRDHSTT